jgi:hypothetical protein
MKARRAKTSLNRRSRNPSRMAGLRTLEPPPLRPERALEMLWHAYNYVRGLDVEGASSAADLLLSNYRELRRKHC